MLPTFLIQAVTAGVLAITVAAAPSASPGAAAPPLRRPSREDALAWLAENGVTKGFHNASATLSARDNTPSECVFNTRDSYHYYDWKLPNGQAACYAWTDPVCAQGWWQDPDWTDLQNSLNQLVTMDGWLSTARAGKWLASFDGFTSAFGNRDTTFYIYGMLASGVSPHTTWYGRNTDRALNQRFPKYCS